MGNVLVFCRRAEDRSFLFEACRPLGLIYTSPTFERTLALLENVPFAFALVDEEAAAHPELREALLRVPVLLLAGRDEEKLQELVQGWSRDHFVDYVLISPRPIDRIRLEHLLQTGRDYVKLKADVESLAGAKASAEDRLKRVYTEIKGLRSALSEGLVKEIEKRIALQSRYVRFQHQKERFEETLRKLYAATDVSNLLDSVSDIKDLVGATALSFYIVEENETLGRFLKPLVWDDAILAHADFTSHISALSARDFAASVARTGEDVLLSDPQKDPRFSSRYRDRLRRRLAGLLATPLQHEGNIIGVLEVYNKAGYSPVPAPFTEEDRQILKGLSEHIALAMTKLNLIQYDALTGLLRPDPFFDRIIRKIETMSKRRQESGSDAMVMGDVDWFKVYNDRNGHEAGNRLLRDLAAVLRGSIRDADLLCRYGGEEFLFFLAGVNNMEEALLLTERIRKAVEEHPFEFEAFQPRHDLTMSFGVTLLPKERLASPGVLTRGFLKKFAHEADLALAEAKGKKLAAAGADPRMITKNKVCAYVREKAAVMSKTTILEHGWEKTFSEKRRHQRYFVAAPCVYKENGYHRVATTVDLSLGGARLSTESAFPLAKTLDIFLLLGSMAAPLKGDVVYCQKTGVNSAYFYTGLRFRDLSLADRKLLEAYFLALRHKEDG